MWVGSVSTIAGQLILLTFTRHTNPIAADFWKFEITRPEPLDGIPDASSPSSPHNNDSTDFSPRSLARGLAAGIALHGFAHGEDGARAVRGRKSKRRRRSASEVRPGDGGGENGILARDILPTHLRQKLSILAVFPVKSLE